jgi:sugar lactone lactonase YvrE
MSKYVRIYLVCAAVTVAAIAALALLVWGVEASETTCALQEEGCAEDAKVAPLEGVDLDVTFINREPLYKAYCVMYPWDVPGQPGIPYLCPGTENDKRWPEQGEIVTFTAHVVNKGAVASPAFDYAWTIDGVEVANGTLPALAPAAEVSASYRWPWAHVISSDGQRALGEHGVGFSVDPANAIAETHESNNSLQDRTNAMSFSIYITPEMYEAYNIPVDPKYPASAEDWLQKQIATMNADFANSIYPVTPQGANLRVRINTIGITSTEPAADGAHDGGWYVTADYRHGASVWYDPAIDIDWGLIHELSHQVSLIDLYALGATPTNVFVTDQQGNPANFGFSWPHPGIMGGGDISPHTDYNLYSSHSAGGAATYAGYRNGYYGSHQFDIPLNNYLRILDSQGDPVPGVQVALYQRTGPWDWAGDQGIDSTPEISGTTDGDGIFHLTNRSAHGGTVTLNGHVLHDNPFGVIDIIGVQGLFLVRLAHEAHTEFHWLDITQFNLAYWMGGTISHTFTISSHVPPAGAPESPEITAMRVEGDRVTVCWAASAVPRQARDDTLRVSGYRVYRAVPPLFQYRSAGDLVSGPCHTEHVPVPWAYEGHVYVVVAVDDQGRESGFSNPAWVHDLINPAAVVIEPDGKRLILDPRNGHALIRQNAEGMYLQNVGSVHYHLENTQFMALDANGHLLFSHPGDWYEGRHSLRVATREGTPVLEFGVQGSGPGEFQTPAGVAAWGDACSVEGPHSVDEHTLLLLHFDGNYSGAQGESGVPSGTEFASGRYEQGVSVDGSDTLTYATAGNLNREQGAVEFWLRPNWPGNDLESYTFFEVGDAWFNRMRVMKDGANNLRFMVWDSTTEYGVAYNVGHWQAGEWHHVGATWQGTHIALYVDGLQVGSEGNAHPPDTLAAEMYVGSASWEGQRANAVIDELRISDGPRVGNSETCNRFLVADSGNQRIQAFDSLGNFLAEFGSFGSGAGQFNNPQGLAVDNSGRVIVVDQGNNRLQVLSFDGQAFGYLDSFSEGFQNPTGVTVDASDNIYVADTGNNRVVVLDATGNYLTVFSQPNDGYSGTFNAPRGVAVEPDGNLVVADSGNRRVVTVRGGLPGYKLLLPLVMSSSTPK